LVVGSRGGREKEEAGEAWTGVVGREERKVEWARVFVNKTNGPEAVP